jgi:hypothetical protein
MMKKTTRFGHAVPPLRSVCISKMNLEKPQVLLVTPDYHYHPDVRSQFKAQHFISSTFWYYPDNHQSLDTLLLLFSSCKVLYVQPPC